MANWQSIKTTRIKYDRHLELTRPDPNLGKKCSHPLSVDVKLLPVSVKVMKSIDAWTTAPFLTGFLVLIYGYSFTTVGKPYMP